jgi:hypothetical protein
MSATLPSGLGCCVALFVALGAVASTGATAGATATAPIGLWRGSSTCTDRIAAPACKDEVVVYDFKPGIAPGSVQWQADKVVDGHRQPMGEMTLHFDEHDACWKVQFDSPRSHIVWCLHIDGTHMTGTGTLLPDKQVVRRVDVHKESP